MPGPLLTCVDGGNRSWQTAGLDGDVHDLSCSEGLIYTTSHWPDEYLRCFRADDGGQSWATRNWYGAGVGCPAVVGGYVHLCAGSAVYCMHHDPAKSESEWQIWRYDTPDRALNPAVKDGRVYAVTQSGKVSGLNAASGDKEWDTDLQMTAYGDPAVAGGKLYVLGYDAVSRQLKVVCRDLGGGAVWQTTGSLGSDWGTGAKGSPAVTGAYLYVTSRNKVYCVETGAGNVVWEYAVAPLPESLSAPAVSGGRIYVAGRQKLHCIRAQEGDTGSWSMQRGNPARTGAQ